MTRVPKYRSLSIEDSHSSQTRTFSSTFPLNALTSCIDVRADVIEGVPLREEHLWGDGVIVCLLAAQSGQTKLNCICPLRTTAKKDSNSNLINLLCNVKGSSKGNGLWSCSLIIELRHEVGNA